MQGIGKPEVPRYRGGSYSRRIDDENRLVYDIENGRIIIKSCRGHYHN